MGLMDKVKSMFGQHGDKVDQGIDKAGDVADDKTGGKYTGQVDKAQDAAKDGIDKIDRRGRRRGRLTAVRRRADGLGQPAP